MHFKSIAILTLLAEVTYGQDEAVHSHLRRVMKPDETQGSLSRIEEQEAIKQTKVGEIPFLKHYS